VDGLAVQGRGVMASGAHIGYSVRVVASIYTRYTPNFRMSIVLSYQFFTKNNPRHVTGVTTVRGLSVP